MCCWAVRLAPLPVPLVTTHRAQPHHVFMFSSSRHIDVLLFIHLCCTTVFVALLLSSIATYTSSLHHLILVIHIVSLLPATVGTLQNTLQMPPVYSPSSYRPCRGPFQRTTFHMPPFTIIMSRRGVALATFRQHKLPVVWLRGRLIA